MTDQLARETRLLRAAYAAFNARDIGAALALMTADVTWPKAFKGGFVRGPDEIRAYWTEQWSEIDPHVEPVAFYPQDASQVLVDVHQVVRSLTGAVLADEHVGHRFTIDNGLIQAMEVCPRPPSGPVRGMLIRDFIPGEEMELRRVFMSSVHELARGFYTPEQLDAWAPVVHDKQDWANRIAALRPFVATIEDRVAGYADLQDSGYIDHFFVSGDFPARGVGSALMQHVHGVALERGQRKLSAQVSLSAEGFFARHGFLVDERQTVVVAGVPMENSRMSKGLTADS